MTSTRERASPERPQRAQTPFGHDNLLVPGATLTRLGQVPAVAAAYPDDPSPITPYADVSSVAAPPPPAEASVTSPRQPPTASRVEQAAGAVAVLGEPVVAVGEVAAVDRQAAASHAVGEVVAELLEMTDARVQLGLPASRRPFPVAAGRRAASRQLGEGGGDVGSRDADALGDTDQRYAP